MPTEYSLLCADGTQETLVLLGLYTTVTVYAGSRKPTDMITGVIMGIMVRALTLEGVQYHIHYHSNGNMQAEWVPAILCHPHVDKPIFQGD